ncbi:adhesin [Bordetella trematum]|nr:adhesin [Bordetella trematum]
MSSRLSQELGPQAPPLKGYAGRIDVDADGRKHPVETAGLGPKRKRSASPDDAPQAKSAPPATEPLGPLPPALARYLAEPANRQRHDVIAAPEDGLEHRRIDTHLASGSHEIVDRRYGDDPPNRFVNAFRPDEWILQANFRPNRQAPYYTSDVILAQYRQVSQRDGFAGVIPKRLVATEVINLPTHERLRRTPEGGELTRTLADIPLGKAARHVVEQGLGATLGPTRWDASTLSLTLNLQPQEPGAAATAPDRYGHRMIVPLDNDALTRQAAERLFAKHPDNSLLLQADDQGRWQIARGEAPAAGGNAKIQFVGHGTRQGEMPLLGGMDAPYLAAMTQGLRPLLGNDGQIDKVALVGCGTASCPGQDLLSQLQPALQASGLHPALSGHPGRVDVDALGRKHPVDSGGLGEDGAGGPAAPVPPGPRLVYENVAGQISVSPQGRQLIIYAHGSADPSLDTTPGMSTHVRVPAGSRMDFYALEGQPSVAVPRFLVADFPAMAEAGLPAFTPYHRQAYRKLARQDGQTFNDLLRELGEGGRRKETLPAGSLVKNYLMSPTFTDGGDIQRFNRNAPHNGVDMIVPVARPQPVHLNELLDLVAATGHHYPIIHCVACRGSRPALEPPTDPAIAQRIQALRQRPLPNPGWMRSPAPDPAQDRYGARLILQQGTDIQSRLAADSLFGKHPRNSVLALQDAKDELQLLRVGDATEPTRIKLQVVGSAASLRGELLLGGNNSVELSDWMQTVMRRLNWPLQSLAKVTMIDCTPGNCGATALLDQVRARMAGWHPPAGSLLRGYDHSILVGPDGSKAPFPPLPRRAAVPGPDPEPAPGPAP